VDILLVFTSDNILAFNTFDIIEDLKILCMQLTLGCRTDFTYCVIMCVVGCDFSVN